MKKYRLWKWKDSLALSIFPWDRNPQLWLCCVRDVTLTVPPKYNARRNIWKIVRSSLIWRSGKFSGAFNDTCGAGSIVFAEMVESNSSRPCLYLGSYHAIAPRALPSLRTIVAELLNEHLLTQCFSWRGRQRFTSASFKVWEYTPP